MTKESLWSYLQNVVPNDATPVVSTAIRAMSNLAGIGSWKPTPLHWYTATKVVDWGIPFTLTEHLASLQPLRQKIGGSIAAKGEPNSSDLSEVDAAALMVINKAQQIERIKTGKARTPDFHVQWDSDQIIAVEVTRAERKQAHIERMEFATHIGEQIYSFHLPWDIIIYIADILDENETHHLIETVRMTKPEEYVSNFNKWWLYIETPNRALRQIDFSHFSRPLKGWPPETVAGGFAIHLFPDSLESTTPNPLVYVGFGVPVSGYINRIDRKATKMQGSKNSPFVIVLDIAELSSGYDEFKRILPVSIQKWPSVSAVLLFKREPYPDKFGWTWQLYPNPQAEQPLPSTMLQYFSPTGELCSAYWNYMLK